MLQRLFLKCLVSIIDYIFARRVQRYFILQKQVEFFISLIAERAKPLNFRCSVFLTKMSILYGNSD